MTNTHPNAADGIRRLASGRWGLFDHGRLTSTHATEDEAVEEWYGPPEPPSCSICDALGHGYPGGGPCPLEDTGEDDPRERELWAEEDRRRWEYAVRGQYPAVT